MNTEYPDLYGNHPIWIPSCHRADRRLSGVHLEEAQVKSQFWRRHVSAGAPCAGRQNPIVGNDGRGSQVRRVSRLSGRFCCSEDTLQITSPRRGSSPATFTAKTPKLGLQITAVTRALAARPELITYRDSPGRSLHRRIPADYGGANRVSSDCWAPCRSSTSVRSGVMSGRSSSRAIEGVHLECRRECCVLARVSMSGAGEPCWSSGDGFPVL